jgi:acetolactate synthase-1/3 small subunit
MNGKFIISILSEDKKGLLNQITSVFNKKNYEIESLCVARTDIRNIVMITVEALLPSTDLQNTLFKLERFIEVYRADAHCAKTHSLRKVAFFRVSKEIMTSHSWSVIQKYGASITGVFEDSLLLEKTGTDADIQELYNKLDGSHLLSFCKTTLVLEESMSTMEGLF